MSLKTTAFDETCDNLILSLHEGNVHTVSRSWIGGFMTEPPLVASMDVEQLWYHFCLNNDQFLKENSKVDHFLQRYKQPDLRNYAKIEPFFLQLLNYGQACALFFVNDECDLTVIYHIPNAKNTESPFHIYYIQPREELLDWLKLIRVDLRKKQLDVPTETLVLVEFRTFLGKMNKID